MRAKAKVQNLLTITRSTRVDAETDAAIKSAAAAKSMSQADWVRHAIVNQILLEKN